MMSTAVTELGAITAALNASAAHPDLPLPMQFTQGLDYWPKNQAEATEIRVALDEVFPGRLRWTTEPSIHSRHIQLSARLGGHGGDRIYTIWIPDPA